MTDTAQADARRTDPWGGRVRAVWGVVAMLYALGFATIVVVSSAFVQRDDVSVADARVLTFGWPRGWLRQEPTSVSAGVLLGDIAIVFAGAVLVMLLLAAVFRAAWHRR